MDDHQGLTHYAKARREAVRFWDVLSVAILILVVIQDCVIGLNGFLSLLFLIPIAVATRFVNVRAGHLFSVLAAATLLIRSIYEGNPVGQVIWDVGVRYCVCLTFVLLFSFIKSHANNVSRMRVISGTTGLILTCTVAFSTIGWALHRADSSEPSIATTMAADVGPVVPSTPMEFLAQRVDEMIQTSRPVLLGSRDPNGPSCVAIITKGNVLEAFKKNIDDLDGGPGIRMAMLQYFNRRELLSIMQDFDWHQARFKTYLRNQIILNRRAGQVAHEAHYEALRLYRRLQTAEEIPDNFEAIDYTNTEDWPGYCVASLDRALKVRNLSEARRWAAELVGATFAFDDLHRWYEFLIENQLVALDFQKSCRTLFENAGKTRGFSYDFESSIGNFPAGTLSMYGVSNYLEIERQAEQLYTVPLPRIASIIENSRLENDSYWVLPELRKPFEELKSALRPPNQLTWSDAVRTPYHRSYVMNMLFRASSATTVDLLRSAFAKLDSFSPNANVNELMDVLMYRGYSFGGLEWDDRFHPDLMQAGQEIAASQSNAQAFIDAWKWSNNLFNPDKYGMTYTLRDAIDRKQLDCNRATDMTGAIFRNAGRARFGYVRWCAETSAHTVAAYLGAENGIPKTLILDALDPNSKPEEWPATYFKGHDWPAVMPQGPTPYAVELYGRGLDNYIWLEGYIIRGPNAGLLSTAAVPYSQIRQEYDTKKVFDGPYPN